MVKVPIVAYTDGACKGNPGPGGWASIMQFGQHEKELTGGCYNTTNNRMELTAVIETVCACKRPCAIHIVTDSTYVMSKKHKKNPLDVIEMIYADALEVEKNRCKMK